jgi:hypothetical protein
MRSRLIRRWCSSTSHVTFEQRDDAPVNMRKAWSNSYRGGPRLQSTKSSRNQNQAGSESAWSTHTAQCRLMQSHHRSRENRTRRSDNENYNIIRYLYEHLDGTRRSLRRPDDGRRPTITTRYGLLDRSLCNHVAQAAFMHELLLQQARNTHASMTMSNLSHATSLSCR